MLALVRDEKCGIKRHVEVYDWSPWRGNLIRASYDGQNVGKIIGKQLANEYILYCTAEIIGGEIGKIKSMDDF